MDIDDYRMTEKKIINAPPAKVVGEQFFMNKILSNHVQSAKNL